MPRPNEIVEFDEPVADGPRQGRGLATAVVMVVAALTIVAGVMTARGTVGDAAPTRDGSGRPGPQVAVLDDTGVGPVRLGMTAREYRGLHRPHAGWGRSSRLVALDYSHTCIQYESVAPSADVVWVWLRNEIVVAVGIETEQSSGDASSRLATSGSASSQYGPSSEPVPGSSAFGAQLGRPLAAVAELPQRWSWERSGPLRLARRSTEAGWATLADVDGDGSLDYARTATAAADACDVDPRRSPELQSAVPGPATIVGDSLRGVSLGLAADSVATVDGWFELGSPLRSCRRFGAGHGASAQALGGRVVALSADRLSEGPSVGDTLGETLKTLGLGASHRDIPRGDWHVAHQLGVLPDGRQIVLESARPYQLYEALDRSYPSGEPTVRRITLGRPCTA